MRAHPSPKQRWRVSVYKIGDLDRACYPAVHKSCRLLQTAYEHFDHFAKLVQKGEFQRAILHQGKLYTGYNAYIENDTDWWRDNGGYVPGRGRSVVKT